MKPFNRRQFLAGIATSSLAIAQLAKTAAAFRAPKGKMPVRVLGKTGVSVGIMALGGGVGAVTDFPTDELAAKFVNDCIDAGINYLDTAPVYGHKGDEGSSERRYGLALKGRRDRVYLATKVEERDADGAMRGIEASMKRLQVDYLDGIQIHNVMPKDDIPSWGKPDGVYTAITKLKQQKVVRYIGITGHTDGTCLKQALEAYEFDTILTTFNPTKVRREFEDLVLPVTQKQNVGVVAMKVFGGARQYNRVAMDGLPGRVVDVEPNKFGSDALLRYALSLPIHTATSGIGSYDQLSSVLAVCHGFHPMGDDERKALQAALHDSDVLLAYNKPGYEGC